MPKTSDLGLLFLHALPLDGSMWAGQRDLIPGRTYAPTVYGFGTSLKDWALEALSLAKEEKLIVVGCSVGGSCALEVAQLAPERMAALVLVGTKPSHRPEPAVRDEALTLIENEGLGAAWDSYWAPLFSPETNPSIVAYTKDKALNLPASDIANGVSVFHSRESSDAFVAGCDIPITMVTGEHDMAPGVRACEEIAASAKRGSLQIIPNAGHYVPLEQPQAFRKILEGVVAAHA
eukprot:s1_g2490.t1